MTCDHHALQVRAQAFDLALRTPGAQNVGQNVGVITEIANQIETFIWGGMQPVSTVGPLGDLAQIDAAVKQMAQQHDGVKIALPQWERFLADAHASLSVNASGGEV